MDSLILSIINAVFILIPTKETGTFDTENERRRMSLILWIQKFKS